MDNNATKKKFDTCQMIVFTTLCPLGNIDY